MDTAIGINTTISKSIIGKRVQFIARSNTATLTWNNTIGMVTEIDLEYNQITIRVQVVDEHLNKYIGDLTKFPVDKDWGYILLDNEWDE